MWAGYCFLAVPALPIALVGVAVSYVASLMPDWINPGSPDIDMPGWEGHRGLSHWLIVPIILSFWWVPDSLWHLRYALGLAWASHILLDTLNNKPFMAFWPIPRRIGLNVVKYNGPVDRALSRILLALAGLLGVLYLLELIT